jgi:regulator of sigma E protease
VVRFLLTAVATIFVFGLLVFFHELGHYGVARMVGVKVLEFSLGFGPKLYSYTKNETVYNIRAVPLGGFVRMYGMDRSDEENEENLDETGSFNSKTVGQRAAVIIAGPLMNFVLAAVLAAVVFIFQGIPTASTVIKEMLADFPAASSGLMVGDKVLAVDGQRLNDWESFATVVGGKPGEEITITVERDNLERQFYIVTKADDFGQGKIGVVPETGFQRAGPFTALVEGFIWTGKMTAMMVDYLTKMIRGREAVDLAGPVGIVSVIGEAANVGFFYLLYIAAFLSINLGLLNLLPIPALDGSRVLFLSWEKIYGRPVDPQKENYIHLVGFAFLITLILVVTYKDIIRLFASGG